MDVPFLVHDPQVAGEQEAVSVEGRGGLVGLSVVALHDTRPLHRDLSDALDGKLAPVPLQHPDRGARERLPHREPTLLSRVVGTGDAHGRGGLGQGVGHQEPGADPGLHLTDQPLPHGSAGGHPEPQGAEVPGGGPLLAQLGGEQGGDAELDRHAETLHEVQRGRRVELVLQHQGGPREQGPQDARAHPEDVEEGRHARDPVAGLQAHDLRRAPGGTEEVAVGEAHPFRLPRRAGCVEDREQALRSVLLEDRRGVVPSHAGGEEVLELEDAVVVPEVLLAHRHQVLQLRQLDQQILEELQVIHALERLHAHRRRGFRVAEHVPELGDRETGIEGNDHGAQLGRREHAHDELRPGGKEQGQPIPRLDAEAVERGGKSLGPAFDLAEAERFVPEEDERPLRIRRGPMGQRRRDGEASVALGERHCTSGSGSPTVKQDRVPPAGASNAREYLINPYA
jgi:hypothetical protein